jgi:sugar (pentulose or hexulose) kinase
MILLLLLLLAPCCRVLFELVAALPQDVVSDVGAVAFDGTSATAMLVDAATGQQLAAPKLYNEAQGAEAVAAAKVRAYVM